jgi:hypothetical protein
MERKRRRIKEKRKGIAIKCPVKNCKGGHFFPGICRKLVLFASSSCHSLKLGPFIRMM